MVTLSTAHTYPPTRPPHTSCNSRTRARSVGPTRNYRGDIAAHDAPMCSVADAAIGGSGGVLWGGGAGLRPACRLTHSAFVVRFFLPAFGPVGGRRRVGGVGLARRARPRLRRAAGGPGG